MRRSVTDWAARLDPPPARAEHWPLGWLVAAAVMSALLATAAYAPSLRGFFGLRLWPVLGLQLLSLACAIVLTGIDRSVGFAPFARGVAILTVSFFFQLFASGVVVFAKPPGSFVLASVPLLSYWLHGLDVRATPRAPHALVAHAAGMLAAIALRPSTGSALVLLLAFPLGALGGLALGSLAEAETRRRRQLADQRSTIEAQLLEAQAIERDRIAETLVVLGERRADARRLLAAAQGDVQRLETRLAALPAEALGEGTELARGLRTSLQRLESAVADVAAVGSQTASAEPPHPVDVAAVAREVVGDAARRFPGVTLAGPSRAAPSAARALVRGGEDSLRLMLDHLVANACEGNGTVGASSVDVAVRSDAPGRVVDVIVSDDGPGLRADLVAAQVRPFVTTKRDGSGLGLYTAARLAAASGGELLRENPPGGGARLTVRLRAADAGAP